MAQPYTDTGTVEFVPISGGFWGIITTSGARLRPVEELGGDFQNTGLNVEFSYIPDDRPNIFMWGKGIRILTIKQAT